MFRRDDMDQIGGKYLLNVDGLMDEQEKELFNAVSRDMDEDIAAMSLNIDGFTFGERTDIYNPWSIINFLDKKKLSAYWANTSSNSLVGKLIREGSKDVKMTMEDLLHGGTLHTKIDEQIVIQPA